MGYIKYIKKLYKKNPEGILRDRLISWRKSPVIVKVEKPTRVDRARALGYKAKQGVVIARVRLLRGGRKRELIKKGRRSKHKRRKKIVNKSYQWIAEERANKKFKNCEVIGSYKLAQDGKHYFFEIILADRTNPSVLANKNLREIVTEKRRVFRGLTSSGRKSRGLRSGKGKGYEKVRPSRNANRKRRKS